MKLLFTLSMMIQFSFAGVLSSKEIKQKSVDYNESRNYVETIIDESIGKENTCLDEYILREQQLKKWLIWAPPLGIIGTPVAAFGAGAVTGVIVNAAGVTGWNGLGWVLGGALLGFTVGTVATLGITTVSAVKFYNNRELLKLIVESHQDDMQYTKKLHKFLKKYNKSWPSDEMDIDTFKGAISRYDSDGSLCDGSMRNTDLNYKLKHRIARKWDLLNQIHLDYGL